MLFKELPREKLELKPLEKLLKLGVMLLTRFKEVLTDDTKLDVKETAEFPIELLKLPMEKLEEATLPVKAAELTLLPQELLLKLL